MCVSQTENSNSRLNDDLQSIKVKLSSYPHLLDELHARHKSIPRNTKNILPLAIGKFEALMAEQFFDNNNEKIADYITSQKSKIDRIETLALIEIAYNYWIYLNSIKNSFYISSDCRGEIARSFIELCEFKERFKKLSKDDNASDLNHSLEHFIAKLRKIDSEIKVNTTSNKYSFISKNATSLVPLVVGAYQIISVWYFNLNPLYPVLLYILYLLFLKFIAQVDNLEYFKKQLKNRLTDLMIPFLLLLLLVSGVALMEVPNYEITYIAIFISGMILFTAVLYYTLLADNEALDLYYETYNRNLRQLIEELYNSDS